jgi:hypothetical protein
MSQGCEGGEINRTITVNDGADVLSLAACKWATYRKRPVAIRAAVIDVPFEVETLEGVMRGAAGDYLIEGVAGELYPCKREIFVATYDKEERKPRIVHVRPWHGRWTVTEETPIQSFWYDLKEHGPTVAVYNVWWRWTHRKDTLVR